MKKDDCQPSRLMQPLAKATASASPEKKKTVTFNTSTMVASHAQNKSDDYYMDAEGVIDYDRPKGWKPSNVDDSDEDESEAEYDDE